MDSRVDKIEQGRRKIEFCSVTELAKNGFKTENMTFED